MTERGPAARRDMIRRRILDVGFARVDDLVREFDVSLMTVHRDLDTLVEEGWISKIRGGATANPSALVDAGVRERSAAMAAEKDAICRSAEPLLAHGQTVFLDDSTTILGLVPHLLAQTSMTVATNFVPLAQAFGESPGLEVVLLGGSYHPRQESCHGLQTVEAIDAMHADIFVMSTTAVMDGRCLHRSEPTVATRRAFMRNATRSVLLVDHAKFGRPAPHMLCRVEDFDLVITDDGIDASDLEALRNRGAHVEVADTSSSAR